MFARKTDRGSSGARHLREAGPSGGPLRRHGLAVALAALWVCLLAAPPTRSVAFGLIGLVCLGALVTALVAPTSAGRALRGLPRGPVAAIAVVTVAFLAFIGWYLSQYHFVPTWDQTTYWWLTLRLNETMDASVVEAFRSVVVSILNLDYNYLLCWVLSVPVRLLRSWGASMFSVVALFNVPAALIVSSFVMSRLPARADARPSALSAALHPVAFACALLAPVALHPALDGLMDAPAYLLTVAVLVALLDGSLTSSALRAVLVGVGVCGTFLLRRYFFYAVMGLAAGALVYWLCALARSEAERRRALFGSLLRALVGIVVVFAAVCVVFRRFIALSLFGGQQEAYQAYTHFFTLADKLGDIVSSVGPAWVVLCAACVVALVARRLLVPGERLGEPADAWLACLVSAAASLLLFWRVQDLGMQHWFIFLGQLEVVLLLPPLTVVAGLLPRAVAGAAEGLLALLSVAGLLSGLTLLPDALGVALPHAIQTIDYEADYDERVALVDYLADETAGGETVYFAAASYSVNSGLGIGVALPDSTVRPYALADADVDLRDGFNTAFFDAEFVVCADPTQTHLSEGTERIVEMLNELVSDPKSYVGRHYEPRESFSFDGGVTVTVYERVSDFMADDVRRLQGTFDEIYPDYPELFHDRFEEYLDAMGE